ncbi:hypothetical protein NYA9BBAC_02815 [Salinibacterium sp. NYA9b]
MQPRFRVALAANAPGQYRQVVYPLDGVEHVPQVHRLV